MRKPTIAGALLLFLMGALPVQADNVVLQDWTFNINGNTNFNCLPAPCSPNTPPFLNLAAFDFATGLGTVTGTFTGTPGSYYMIFYVDHDIVGGTNPLDDEMGGAFGTPLAGQSWEIDEPGFTTGQLVMDVVNGVLTNSAWPSGTPSPNDVAMALGWAFVLGAGDVATLHWTVSTTAPSGGFYLEQTDPNGTHLYFSSQLQITPNTVIPEPATGLLLLTGAGLITALRRRTRK